MTVDYGALEKVESEAHELKRVFLRLSTSRYVMGEGANPQAFIVGEAPGADEDVKGRPFVGPAGEVLRQLMDMADFRATPQVHKNYTLPPNCWLTNVVKFRPPRNGTPTETEIKAFRPLLLKEWRAVGKPRIIIPVGGVALQAIIGRRVSILKAAGKCHSYKGCYIWPMVHPSYGMRSNNEQLQEILEQDWVNLRKWRNAKAIG